MRRPPRSRRCARCGASGFQLSALVKGLRAKQLRAESIVITSGWISPAFAPRLDLSHPAHDILCPKAYGSSRRTLPLHDRTQCPNRQSFLCRPSYERPLGLPRFDHCVLCPSSSLARLLLLRWADTRVHIPGKRAHPSELTRLLDRHRRLPWTGQSQSHKEMLSLLGKTFFSSKTRSSGLKANLLRLPLGVSTTTRSIFLSSGESRDGSASAALPLFLFMISPLYSPVMILNGCRNKKKWFVCDPPELA